MTLSRILFVGLFLTAFLLAAGFSVAAPRATNPGAPFEQLADQHVQIQEEVEEVAGVLVFPMVEIQEKLEEIGDVLVFPLVSLSELILAHVKQVEFGVRLPAVQANVDTAACAAGFPACGLMQQFGPATDQNDRPIRMVVLVARDGVGVEGLTAEAFDFDNPFFPAGGPKAVPCDSNCGPMWFYEGGSGLYAMFLEPSLEGNWQAGRYAAAVKVALDVTDPHAGSAQGTTLVTFEIPSALGLVD